MQTPLETVCNSLANTVLIKTGSGNVDLESSQSRSGVPGETGMVSVADRSLSFLKERFAARGCVAEKGQNVGNKRKTPSVDLSSSGVNFWVFFPYKKLRLKF